MTPHPHQLQQLLTTLLEDLAKQEEAAQMLLSIRKHLTAHSNATHQQTIPKPITDAYQERIQRLRPRILSALKQLQAVLKEQQWASPSVTYRRDPS